MKPLTCAATRRRLNAFHDHELPVSEQIAVDSHLDWCDECGALAADFGRIRTALKVGARGQGSLSYEQAAVFTAAVIARLKAEREAALLPRVRMMFDDMHLVYAGLGAAIATAVCLVVMLSMMRFATAERPDSLAAMVNLVATPGATGMVAPIDDEMRTRWTALVRQGNETAEQDVVFTLATVVTRDGRLAVLEHHHGRNARRASRDEARLIEALLDEVSRARLEPDFDELTSSTLWLVTRTTVRATRAQALDLQLPGPKKHTASATVPIVPA